jgi:hypothetical protein
MQLHQQGLRPADDGNIYVMRTVAPATISAISPLGEIVRTFTIKSKDNYRPFTMHISGNRLAVMFYEPHTPNMFIKVIDLEGNEITTYNADNPIPPNPTANPNSKYLGLDLACYEANPDRFTFLGNDQGAM